MSVDVGMVEVGTLTRREVDEVVATYSFDLRTNQLTTTLIHNPNAGKSHQFKAYRLKSEPADAVSLRSRGKILAELKQAGAQREEDERS